LKSALEDFDKAIAVAGQLPANDKPAVLAQAYWRRGETQLASNNLRQALDDLDKAVKLSPALAGAYNGRGMALRAQREFRAALASFDKAIELDPRQAETYSNRALTKMIERDFSGAIADYSLALEINPNLAGLYLNRGVVRRAWGDEYHREAEQRRGRDKDRAAEVDKDAKEQWNLAIADFDKAIKLDRKTPLVYEHRAEAKRAVGDLEGAIDDFTHQLEVKPDSSTAYNNRGLARQQKGDTQGALQDFTRAIEVNRDDAMAYANRGLLRLQLALLSGSRELEANQDFEACLQLQPQLKPQLDQIIRNLKAQVRDQAKAEAEK
jgi:tetratricopeptide (TPR) repeat protein